MNPKLQFLYLSFEIKCSLLRADLFHKRLPVFPSLIHLINPIIAYRPQARVTMTKFHSRIEVTHNQQHIVLI